MANTSFWSESNKYAITFKANKKYWEIGEFLTLFQLGRDHFQHLDTISREKALLNIHNDVQF
jgi:hypothetical protein